MLNEAELFWNLQLNIENLPKSFYSYYYTQKFSNRGWIYSINFNFAYNVRHEHNLVLNFTDRKENLLTPV